MLRLVGNLLLGGAGGACGCAAVAVALYAGNPAQATAAALFASVGFVAVLLWGGLHAVVDGLPVLPVAAMRPEALASLVRATLASAVAERAPRPGSAAGIGRRAADHGGGVMSRPGRPQGELSAQCALRSTKVVH